jgi:hypothetical protein
MATKEAGELLPIAGRQLISFLQIVLSGPTCFNRSTRSRMGCLGLFNGPVTQRFAGILHPPRTRTVPRCVAFLESSAWNVVIETTVLPVKMVADFWPLDHPRYDWIAL